MKRLHFQPVSSGRIPSIQTEHRRGAIFALCMVYMLVAGATAATAGMLLHTMFRARTADEVRANSLRQVLRIEQILRDDWNSGIEFQLTDNSLTIQGQDDLKTRYNIQKNTVHRIQTDSENQVVARDRFAFSKSTAPNVLERPAKGKSHPKSVVFKLSQFAPIPKKSSASNTAVQIVEIILPVLRQKSESTDSALNSSDSGIENSVDIKEQPQ